MDPNVVLFSQWLVNVFDMVAASMKERGCNGKQNAEFRKKYPQGSNSIDKIMRGVIMTPYDTTGIYPEFHYPSAFIKIMNLNIIDLDWWYLMCSEDVETRLPGLQKRYPQRKLIPFARRDDSDDIACFEVGKGTTVQIIHDFASSGYEQRGEYVTTWEWFQDAVEEMIQNEILSSNK